MKKAMAVMAILIWYVWGVPHAHAEPRFTFSHEWSFSFPQYEFKDEGRTGVLIGLYNDSSMYYFNLGFNLTRPLEEDGTTRTELMVLFDANFLPIMFSGELPFIYNWHVYAGFGIGYRLSIFWDVTYEDVIGIQVPNPRIDGAGTPYGSLFVLVGWSHIVVTMRCMFYDNLICGVSLGGHF